jgi:hypothetical protein
MEPLRNLLREAKIEYFAPSSELIQMKNNKMIFSILFRLVQLKVDSLE